MADELTPLAALLVAHAGRDAPWHRLVWTLDARFAQIVRTIREPMIARIRLTWWHEALGDAAQVKGKGEPLLDALRARPERLADLQRMAEGWEDLIGEEVGNEELVRYAECRGGGLFRALAKDAEVSEAAGASWALWDLSGHVSDEALGSRAVEMAEEYRVKAEGAVMAGVPRILAGMAAVDIAAGRAAPAALTPRFYGRIVRIALIGR